MGYVLWIYFPAIAGGIWLYMFTLGGDSARGVLTLGIYGSRPAPPAASIAPAPRLRAIGRASMIPHVMTAAPAIDLATDTLLVQHAAPMVTPSDQLDDPTGEYRPSWDNFPDRLLATLNGRTGAIRLSGWEPGDWRAAA